MVIYLLSFPNNKHYVGRTMQKVEERWAQHKYRASQGHQHPLYYAINKYGWENVHKQVLQEVLDEYELINLELDYIIKYDSVANGYNLTLNTEIGGDNWKGKRNTEAFEDFREKMKAIAATQSRGGRVYGKEARNLMKIKAKGRYTLEWFQQRNGEEEGLRLYTERSQALKQRKLQKDSTGRFIKGG